MNYTIQQFNTDFPNDIVCLDIIFKARYGDITICPSCGVADTKFYRVKSRKCYECKDCGYQINPLSGTIFHKSSTPLVKWFFAIFLFANSKNGVSAKELERHLGVTYKCAWRMANRIRKLMSQDGGMLSGIVEADETYVGGRHKNASRFSTKSPVLGLVQRQGDVKARVADAHATNALNFIASSLDETAELHTDESRIYHRVSRFRTHEIINHSKQEYSRGHVTTNTIEGFWSQLKRSLDGTHHSVSPKYLQLYVDERVFHYNHRNVPVYPLLLARAARLA